MCGICGIHRLADPEAPDADAIARETRQMLAPISHRGKLDSIWHDTGIGLGSRRLPIVDLEGASQPIFNENRSLVLVGNGEIYNHAELDRELKASGHRYGTNGDLECILHLYEDHGDALWERLRGMFAVALWDTRRRRLILARDPIGIKPLFYWHERGLFLFGSEIKCITAHPSFVADLNPQAISDFLSLQFVPKPQTVYRGVLSVPAGSFLALEDGHTAIHRFWELRIADDDRPRDGEAWAEEVRERLATAVQRRLMSDVPLGVLLSGGLDSTAIAALAARDSSTPVSTFAIVFKETSFDESPFSRLAAEHLKTDHHELVLSAPTMLDSMERMAYFFDEPFCEGSAFPIFHICQYAKDFVTVLLSGEGADEIFGGYEPYTAQILARYYRALPGVVRRAARWGTSLLPVSDNKVSLDLKLRRFTAGADFDPPTAHFWWRAAMNDDEKRSVLDPDFSRSVERLSCAALYRERYANLASNDTLNRIMATDCQMHLVDDLLVRTDRMGMAHTMELRVPFLDVDLVELAFSIPSRSKLGLRQNKIPLRAAMQGLIPEQIRTRSKMGLNMPYQKWFKQSGWRELLHDSLSEDSLGRVGILNARAVRSMLASHVAGTHNHAHALWAILNLVLWLQRQPTGTTTTSYG